MNLYVSNPNPTSKEDELRIFFQKAGSAIQQLTNTSLADRKLVISKARERSTEY